MKRAKKIFISTCILAILPVLTHAKNLIRDAVFSNPNANRWAITGKCQENPEACIFESTTEDFENVNRIPYYHRFGRKNNTELIAQIVKLKSNKKKLRLRLRLKLSNSSQAHYKTDLFSIIVTGREIGYDRRIDIPFDPNNQGWQKLSVNLNDVNRQFKGKKIVVSFFMRNNGRGVTKAHVTKISLKQRN